MGSRPSPSIRLLGRFDANSGRRCRCGASREARRVLTLDGVRAFNVPVEQLAVSEAVITVKPTHRKRVTSRLVGERQVQRHY